MRDYQRETLGRGDTRTEGENIINSNHYEREEMTYHNTTSTAPRPTWAATVESPHATVDDELALIHSAVITLEHDAHVSAYIEQWATRNGEAWTSEPTNIIIANEAEGCEGDVVISSAAAARDLAAALLQLADTLDGERPITDFDYDYDHGAPYSVRGITIGIDRDENLLIAQGGDAVRVPGADGGTFVTAVAKMFGRAIGARVKVDLDLGEGGDTDEQREVRRPVSHCAEPQQDGLGGGL